MEVLDLVPRRGAHHVVGLADGCERELVHGKGREDVRHGHQLRGVELSGSLASFGASSSSCARAASEPREMVERPSLGSGEMTSNHAEE